MGSTLYYLGSIGSGLLFGWLFVALWRKCAPSEINRRFWSSLGDIAKGMVAVDEFSELLALYRRLAVGVGRYVGRNLGGLVLGCLPVAAFLVWIAPVALDQWDRGAERLGSFPPTAVAAVTSAADQPDAAPELSDLGSSLRSSGRVGRTAVCWTGTECTVFRLLAFHVIETPQALLDRAPYIVFRAERGNGNLLWPYLNDLEFAFFCAFVAASIGGLLWGRAAR